MPSPKKDVINIKNIIPNLARKLLSFLLSSQCRGLISQLYPELGRPEITKVLAFVTSIKNSFNSYVGKKNLKRLWQRGPKSSTHNRNFEVIRRLSRFYL